MNASIRDETLQNSAAPQSDRGRLLAKRLAIRFFSPRIRRRHKAQIEALLSALDSCTRSRIKAEKAGFTHLTRIYNLSQYTLLCNFDLTVLGHDIVLQMDSNKQKLYARMLAMTLLESVEDITQLMGKEFRETVEKLSGNSEFESRTRTVSKGFNDFKKSHEKMLREIRNIAAAHRELKADVQLELIDKLDPFEVVRVTGDFVGWLEQLVRFLTDLLLTWHNRVKPLVDILKSTGA